MNGEQRARYVVGRQTARAAIDVAYLERLLPESQEAFWEYLRDEALKHVPAPEVKHPGIAPMNELQAEAFERRELPYGKYKGMLVGDLMTSAADVNYLDWLAGEFDEFRQDLNRYLLSDRAKRHPSRRS